MSDLNEFLREAKAETEDQRFQLDYEAGLIPLEELIGRVRFVGNPRSPLAVPYHLSDQDWIDHYANRRFDFDSKPEPPPLPGVGIDVCGGRPPKKRCPQDAGSP
jgi:hypothetical protein